MKHPFITLILVLLTTIAYGQNFTTDITVTSDSGAELNLNNTTSGTTWQVVSGAGGGLEIGNVTGNMTDSDAPLYIKSNGDLGLGTIYPSSNLHIIELATSGLNHVMNRWETSSGGGISLRVSDLSIANPEWQLNTYSGESISFSQGGTRKMSIHPSGFVAIGDITPSEELHIYGTTRIDHSAKEAITFGYEGVSGGSQSIGSNSNGDLILSAHATISGNEHLVIQQNTGNIGIGIESPNSKLVVDGKIRSEEVKVEIIDGPDYVFEPDYELRTLKETKEYIVKNKHLPEIPSAKEMEKNGVELGDMNMRLLKKIEELTLYQIQLMEEMEAMKKELQELKK